MPIYLAALTWVILSMFLPMIKFTSYLILLLISFGVWFVLTHFNVFKDIEIEVETPITYVNSEVEEICLLCDSQIAALHQLDEVIQDEDLSEKIAEIILINEKISDFIQKEPLSVQKTRKYFKYYVDSVIELLRRYADIEQPAFEGENILTSKNKIRETLDISVQAFRNFYDQLYEKTNMEVKVDAKVLEDLLKQEGILEEKTK